MKEIVLPANTEYVLFSEIAGRMADAVWPNDELKNIGYQLALEKKLNEAVDSRALQVKNPLHFGPHGFPIGDALRTALVTVADFASFAARYDIVVRVADAQISGSAVLDKEFAATHATSAVSGNIASDGTPKVANAVQCFVYLWDKTESLTITAILEYSTDAVCPCDKTSTQEMMASRTAYIEHRAKLEQAIRKGTVQPLDPKSNEPQTAWSDESLVTRAQFSKFYESLGIGIKSIYEFTMPVRPLQIDSALLELPPDAQVYVHDFDKSGGGTSSAEDAIATWNATNERQAQGLFTIRETGYILEGAYRNIRAKEWIERIHCGFNEQKLLIYTGAGLKIRDAAQIHDRSSLVKEEELNAWLPSEGHGFRFPPATPEEAPLEKDSDSQNATPIDWQHWRLLREVRLWEAVFLSFGINAEGFEFDDDTFDEFLDANPKLEKRIRQLNDNLSDRAFFRPGLLSMTSRMLHGVRLPEFAAWALHVGFDDMPPELVAMAQAPASQADVPEPAVAELESNSSPTSNERYWASAATWTEHQTLSLVAGMNPTNKETLESGAFDHVSGFNVDKAKDDERVLFARKAEPIRRMLTHQIGHTKYLTLCAGKCMSPSEWLAIFDQYGLGKLVPAGLRIAVSGNTGVSAAPAESKAQGEAGTQGSPRTIQSKTTKRSDALTAVIASAAQNAQDPADYQSVWAELVKLADSTNRPAPLLGFVEAEGVKYQGDNDVKFFTKRNLADRIRRAARGSGK